MTSADSSWAATLSVSATDLQARLAQGADIPSRFTFADVVAEPRKQYPPRSGQGCTNFCTGLSGSGKSTIANVLLVTFLEAGDRPVTLLDGDLVRKHLSSELGFSKEHRDINIRRSGYWRSSSAAGMWQRVAFGVQDIQQGG